MGGRSFRVVEGASPLRPAAPVSVEQDLSQLAHADQATSRKPRGREGSARRETEDQREKTQKSLENQKELEYRAVREQRPLTNQEQKQHADITQKQRAARLKLDVPTVCP